MKKDEVLTINKVKAIQTLKANKEADALFLAELKEHNADVVKCVLAKLQELSTDIERRPLDNFRTKDSKKGFHILKDNRETRYSQKQWNDAIKRVELLVQDEIPENELDGCLLKDQPVFDIKSKAVRSDVVCQGTIQFAPCS